MLNIGPGELVLIFLVGLLVLGPQKLPEAARQVGRAMAELRRLSSGFQAELKSAMDEPTIERSPTPLATPASTPTEEMNAALAKARDEAIAAAEAGSRAENGDVAAVSRTRTAAAAKKAAPAKKKAVAKKKAAAAKKAAPAKKKAAPATKAAATKKR